MVEVQTKYVAF